MRNPVSFKLQQEILDGLDKIAEKIGAVRSGWEGPLPNRTAAINYLVQKELAEMGQKKSGKISRKKEK